MDIKTNYKSLQMMTEYENIKDYNKNCNSEIKSLEELEQETTVIIIHDFNGNETGGFIIIDY